MTWEFRIACDGVGGMQAFVGRWAEQEFGHAWLGGAQRMARLVDLGQRVIVRAAGNRTDAFERADGEPKAVFRFVENRFFL